jgi:hypothetical protein
MTVRGNRVVDAQLNVKLANIPRWAEAGTDIHLGEIDQALCYNEDDIALRTQVPPAGPPLPDEKPHQVEDVGIKPITVQVDPKALSQEKRLRDMRENHRKLQQALEQVDPEMVQSAYSFFKHDPTKISTSAEDRIHQDGALRPYQQHLAYAIFWLMWHERLGSKGGPSHLFGGGILGDEPGFGKVSLASPLLIGPILRFILDSHANAYPPVNDDGGRLSQ